MTPASALISVAPEESCAQAKAHELRHLLVLEDHRLVGVVCCRGLAEAPDEEAVRHRMIREIFALPAHATLGEAAAAMRKSSSA